MKTADDLMTTAEVAHEYNITVSTVFRAVSDKKLSPPVIKGRGSRPQQFRRKDVVSWRSEMETARKERYKKARQRNNLFRSQTRIRWCPGCGLLLVGKITLEPNANVHYYCSAGCFRGRFARDAGTEHEWAYLNPVSLPSQTELYEKAELEQAICTVLGTLTPRDEKILRLGFGIGFAKSYMHTEIAAMYGISRGRVGEIEARALRKLRHPSRSELLAPFVCEERKPAPPVVETPPATQTRVVRVPLSPLPPLANERMEFRVSFNRAERVLDVFLVNFRTAHPEQGHALGQAIVNLAVMLVTHNHPLPGPDFLRSGRGWRSVEDIRMFTKAWHRVDLPENLRLPAGAVIVAGDE